jgi:Spy/CpxP family protein refolding chaperone
MNWMNWKHAAIGVATVLSIGMIPVHAQQSQEPPRMMGPGMMGPGMMGPGMMGPGMMGPGMMGPGMMGFGLAMIGRLDLDEAQRRQVQRIADDLRRKNWGLMGKMHDEMSRMGDAMRADRRDRDAILAANRRMSELRQQMLENMLAAADQAEAVLTPQQREQLRRFAP